MLTARMLGTAAIDWNGKRVVFPFAKMEALLYYLLVKKSCSRAELAALLWSEMDDEAAKKNLRNTLYLLKKMFGESLIQTPSRSLLLLDSKRSGATDVARLLEGEEEDEAAYGGEFLAGFYCKDAALFEEWVNEERQELREIYLSRLTRRGAALLKEKQYEPAKSCLKRLIAIDEYNESAYRSLMRIYSQAGADNKVIAIYQKLESKLQCELGIRPDAKTKEIAELALRRKENDAGAEKSSQAELFFARESERRRLLDWLRQPKAADSLPRFLVLHGEQGVGKSALLRNVFESLADGETLLLRTQCYQVEEAYPYKAWSAIFSQVMLEIRRRGIEMPASWRQVISYFFPAIALERSEEEFARPMDVHALQVTMAQEVMHGLLQLLAGHCRLLLVIEDMQWLDQQGYNVLQQVLRGSASQIDCLATCRSEALSGFAQRFGEPQTGQAIEWLPVERFSRSEVERFAALALDTASLDPQLEEKLYEYTEGNALFLVECFKLLQLGEGVGRLSPRLHSVLTERVGQLSEKARKVLAAASVFFRDASYEELTAVAGLNEFELVEAIEEIQKQKLLEEGIQPGRSHLTYRFCHGCIREFVYGQLSASRRRMLHHRIGLHLEERMQSVDGARELLYAAIHHFAQAGEEAKAIEYRIRLAERYSCPHYEMFPELSAAVAVGGDYDRRQITEHLQQLEELIAAAAKRALGEERISRYQAAYWEMSGRYHIWLGEHRQGLRAIHRLLRLAALREYQEYRVKGYQQVIYCAIQTRRDRIIEAFADKLIRAAADAKRETILGAALRFKGIAYALRGEDERAEQSYRQSIALFKRLNGRGDGYAAHIAAAYNYIGDLRGGQGDWNEALRHYETAIRLHGQATVGEGLTIFYINAGYAAFELGRYDAAKRHLELALVVGEQFGGQMGYWCQRGHCTLNCVLARIACRAGDGAAAQEHLAKAEEFLAKYRDANQSAIIERTRCEMKTR